MVAALTLALLSSPSQADLWRFSAVGTAGLGANVSAGEQLRLSFEYDDGLFAPGQFVGGGQGARSSTSYWRYQAASAIPVSLQGSRSGALALDPIGAITLSRSGSGDVIGLGPVSFISNGAGFFYCPAGGCDSYREIEAPAADNFVGVHALLAGQIGGQLEPVDVWDFFAPAFDVARAVDVSWSRVQSPSPSAPGQSVPEPPALLLLAGVLLALRLSRRQAGV